MHVVLGLAHAFALWQPPIVKNDIMRSMTDPHARGPDAVGVADPTQLAGKGTATGAQFTPIDPVVAQVELGCANRPKPFAMGARHAALVQPPVAAAVTVPLLVTGFRSCAG